MIKKRFGFRRGVRIFQSWLSIFLGAFLWASCGRPANLVMVNVAGLEPSITELHVQLTLDGTKARNLQPSDADPDAYSFAVYKEMYRFGIEIPSGTQQLGVHIDGLNTNRVIIKVADGQLNLNQQQDLNVSLRLP